jgi:hypothetical protein
VDLMIYPRDVLAFLEREEDLRKRFGYLLDLKDLNISGHTFTVDDTNEFEEWMLTEGLQRSGEVKRYIFYMQVMKTIFTQIHRAFPKVNVKGRPERDKGSAATTVDEMLAIARYLYYLHSHGVPGVLLECGCYKGWSSCCLSWACDFLGRKLIVADSFEGLPSNRSRSWEGFQEGDYTGDLEEVVDNVTLLGRLQAVDFIQGWFSESLQGFSQPICLLWIDVDLYQSAVDILENVAGHLSPNGVIFTHEYDEGRSEKPYGPPAAIYEFFTARNIPYRDSPAVGDYLGLVVTGLEGELLFRPEKQVFWSGGLPDQKMSPEMQKLMTLAQDVANRALQTPVLGRILQQFERLLQRWLARS